MTGAHAPSRQPRRQVLIAVLAISLALNLLFLAGAAWSRLHEHPGDRDWRQLSSQMAAQLDLDAQQRAAFDRYVTDMHARSARMHQQITPLLGAAWDEIAKPQPDQGQIMQRYDDASQRWRDFQRESTAQTLEFLATLSPAQRDKFVAVVKERRAARFQHH